MDWEHALTSRMVESELRHGGIHSGSQESELVSRPKSTRVDSPISHGPEDSDGRRPMGSSVLKSKAMAACIFTHSN